MAAINVCMNGFVSREIFGKLFFVQRILPSVCFVETYETL
jgi:hypothetical protein